MKYLIPILIALCFLLLLGYTHDVAEEISEIKARDRLLSQEIVALRGYLAVVDDKTDRIVEEVREIVTVPYSKFIPVSGGWLAIREEEK